MSPATDPQAKSAHGAALLLIDLVNPMDFDGGELLRESTARAVDAILHLRDEADRLGISVIYVNDNFGRWHADAPQIVDSARSDDSPARDIVERLAPRPDDIFVIKPHLSGFYATNLPVLLPRIGASRLILAGVATDICVLFTAADAHMRDYDLWVPSDAVAGESADRHDWALAIMEKSMDAETRPASELALDDWLRGGDDHDTAWIAGKS